MCTEKKMLAFKKVSVLGPLRMLRSIQMAVIVTLKHYSICMVLYLFINFSCCCSFISHSACLYSRVGLATLK
jgi:hypothetical protein